MAGRQARRALGVLGVFAAFFIVLATAGAWQTSAAFLGSGVGFSGRAYAERLMTERGGADTVVLPMEIESSWQSPGQAPSWVGEELVDITQVEDLRATDEWVTIGFSMSEGPSAVCSWLADQLAERGWALAKMGVEGSMTGVKEGGRCTWLWFSCAAVGGRTCVVMQVPTR
ncbi:hypothetical protein AALA69_04190 [Eggerthellaceae bacterium 24-137]